MPFLLAKHAIDNRYCHFSEQRSETCVCGGQKQPQRKELLHSEENNMSKFLKP